MSASGDSAVIIGVYGKGNFGDEALLATVVDDIHSLLPQCAIHVFCSGPESVTERFGFHALSRTPTTGFLEKLALIRRSRFVMVGGGTLLCDHRGPLDNFRVVITYFFWLWLAKLGGVPTLIYGQGFGPARSRIIRLGMWLTRFGCDAVTVRDSASYELLVGIAGKRPRFALGADPVVAADRFLPARVRLGVDDQFAAGIAELQPFLLLAIRYPKLTDLEECRGYFDAFGALAARVCHHTESGVVLFPAHLSDDFVDDRLIMDLIESTLISQGIAKSRIVRAHWSSLNEAAHWLQSADMVFGDRLHALLVAALNCVPVVGVAVENKISACLTDIFHGHSLALGLGTDDLAQGHTISAIEQLWDQRRCNQSSYEHLVAGYRMRHKVNIEALARVIHLAR